MNNSKEIAKQLIEMSLDMDYMDYADCIESEINMIVEELEQIKDTALYSLLDKVVYMNGNEELPLLCQMIKEG